MLELARAQRVGHPIYTNHACSAGCLPPTSNPAACTARAAPTPTNYVRRAALRAVRLPLAELTIQTIRANSTNGSLTARSATFGKVRGSRDGAQRAPPDSRSNTRTQQNKRGLHVEFCPWVEHGAIRGRQHKINPCTTVLASFVKAIAGRVGGWKIL